MDMRQKTVLVQLLSLSRVILNWSGFCFCQALAPHAAPSPFTASAVTTASLRSTGFYAGLYVLHGGRRRPALGRPRLAGVRRPARKVYKLESALQTIVVCCNAVSV